MKVLMIRKFIARARWRESRRAMADLTSKGIAVSQDAVNDRLKDSCMDKLKNTFYSILSSRKVARPFDDFGKSFSIRINMTDNKMIEAPWLVEKVCTSPNLLSKDLKEFYDYVKLSDDEVIARSLIVKDIQKLISLKWPTASSVVFGSHHYGLTTFLSDVDISFDTNGSLNGELDEQGNPESRNEAFSRIGIKEDEEDDEDDEDDTNSIEFAIDRLPDQESDSDCDIELNVHSKGTFSSIKTKNEPADKLNRYMILSNLRALWKLLLNSNFVNFGMLIPAKVPIIYFQSHYGIDIDISTDTVSGQSSTLQISRNFMMANPDVISPQVFCEVSCFLKVLLHSYGLDKPHSGGIGSYRLYAMITHVGNVLKEENRRNLTSGDLLLEFLKYYGNLRHFNGNTSIVCCNVLVLLSVSQYHRCVQLFDHLRTNLIRVLKAQLQTNNKEEEFDMVDVKKINAAESPLSIAFSPKSLKSFIYHRQFCFQMAKSMRSLYEKDNKETTLQLLSAIHQSIYGVKHSKSPKGMGNMSNIRIEDLSLMEFEKLHPMFFHQLTSFKKFEDFEKILVDYSRMQEIGCIGREGGKHLQHHQLHDEMGKIDDINARRIHQSTVSKSRQETKNRGSGNRNNNIYRGNEDGYYLNNNKRSRESTDSNVMKNSNKKARIFNDKYKKNHEPEVFEVPSMSKRKYR